IVGYRNAADTRASAAVFNRVNAIQSFSLIGQERGLKLEVTPLRETELVLKFTLPPSMNAFAADEDFHRRLLDDLAEQIKKMDPRVRYVYPYWLLQIPTPPRINFNENALKQLLAKSAPTAAGMPNDPVFAQGLHWHYQPTPAGMNAVGAWQKR